MSNRCSPEEIENSKEIITIGAGPAGLYSSYLLAKKGYNVDIYEKKKEIGLPVQCTGIVTSKIKNILELKEEVIKNKIKKIELHSRNNTTTLNLKQPDLILDRNKFDKFLAEKATSVGVNIHLNNQLVNINNSSLILKNIGSKKETKISTTGKNIIAADGPLSKFYTHLNPNLKRQHYKGIQVRVNGNFDKDTFTVYLDEDCPDFFQWIVPEDESTARIGLATMHNPKAILDKFLKKIDLKKENIKDKIIETQAGIIPTYIPNMKTAQSNIFLIGDSASQIKSTTGGGIIQSLIASDCLANSISANKNYEKEWKKKLSKDLWIHLKLRKTLNKFKDKDYDSLIACLNNKNIRNILETQSRDNPSKFIFKLVLAQPRLISFISKAL